MKALKFGDGGERRRSVDEWKNAYVLYSKEGVALARHPEKSVLEASILFELEGAYIKRTDSK